MYNIDTRLQILKEAIIDMYDNVDAVSTPILWELMEADKDEMMDLLYDMRLQVEAWQNSILS